MSNVRPQTIAPQESICTSRDRKFYCLGVLSL